MLMGRFAKRFLNSSTSIYAFSKVISLDSIVKRAKHFFFSGRCFRHDSSIKGKYMTTGGFDFILSQNQIGIAIPF